MNLTYKQIERVFFERFGVTAKAAPAFRSRLQHLQRRRIFADLNTGRGTKASYHWGHMIQLMVTLDLIDLGMTPDAAVNRVINYKDQIIYGVRMVVVGFRSRCEFVQAIENGQCPLDNTRFVLTSAAILSLGDGNVAKGEFLEILNYQALLRRLGEDAAIEPAAALINLGSRMMLVAGLAGRSAQTDAQATADDLEQWLEHWANEDTLS